MATLFAVVPAVLEGLAEAEIREKLQPVEWVRAHERRGVVVFRTHAPPAQWFQLRSADNLFAFIREEDTLDATADVAFKQAEDWAASADYGPALEAWKASAEFLPRKKSGNPINTATPTFRATAIREGPHEWHGPDFAGNMAGGTIEKMQWGVDLKEFDLEVYAHLYGTLAVLGISLSRRIKQDLHKRHRELCVRTTLKSSIAYALARMDYVEPGDFVLDPMCGAGTIPIECAEVWPMNFCLGGDIDPEAITASSANSRCSTAWLRPDTVQWSALSLPVRPAVFDKIICDMPYGRRCGSHRDNKRNYGRILSEVQRVLKPGGTALMMTIEHRLMDTILEDNCAPDLRLSACHSMDNSGQWVGLYIFHKIGSPVSSAAVSHN
eukprot:m51a1_g83 hypothetical protein (381) ;mRNA; r:270027-271367